jgi:hypothetical protein
VEGKEKLKARNKIKRETEVIMLGQEKGKRGKYDYG